MQGKQKNQSKQGGGGVIGLVGILVGVLLGWGLGSPLGLLGSLIGAIVGGIAGSFAARLITQGGKGNRTKT